MKTSPQIGDLIAKSGIYTNPGVVTARKEDGTVTVDTDPMSINKYHRYTNTSGLSEPEKNKFNNILDEVYQSRAKDVDKINDIQTQIDALKVDPSNRNVVQYLRNQQAHLIRTARELPRAYNADADSVKI